MDVIRIVVHAAGLLVAALGLVAVAPLAAAGADDTDEGLVHTGVGSEQEARDFPCAPGDAGPVVCVPDRGTPWRLTSDATGECTEGVAGWHGDCVRAFDAGDHLRVWGTRGVPPRSFRITWITPAPEPADGGSTDAGARDGGSTATQQRASGSSEEQGAAPAPSVADPQGGSSASAVAAAPAEAEEPAASRSGRREIPDGIVWDPPVSEVPGYSDLSATAGPTYPELAADARFARQDAGAPAAAGAVALLACGWVAWERHRAGRGATLG